MSDIKALLETLRDHTRTDRSRARALPGFFYLSEELARLEEQALFAKGWVALGREGELPKPGDYFVTELGDEPLLVVRDHDDKVRVLSNVCRHRGMPLAEGSGNARAFSCPYHGWTYCNDGRLIGAPFMQKVPGFDRDACTLPEFRSELWGGFIFANLSDTAPPFSRRLAPIEPTIANYHMPEMRHVFSEEVVWATNWKSLLENFMEGYHLSIVHSRSLGAITPTKLCEHFPAGDAYMGYKSWYPSSCPDRGDCHSDLTADERRCSVMLCVYPGLVLGLCPHQLLYMCLRPRGADQVAARWGLAVHGDVPHVEIEERLALYRTINAEDKAQLEKLNRGLASSRYEPGRLAPEDYEGTLRDFWQYLARELAGTAKDDSSQPVAAA